MVLSYHCHFCLHCANIITGLVYLWLLISFIMEWVETREREEHYIKGVKWDFMNMNDTNHHAEPKLASELTVN